MGKAAREHRRRVERAQQLASSSVVEVRGVTAGRPAIVAAALKGVTDPLEVLEMLHEISRDVEQLQRDSVDRARRRGATWAQIGAVLGVSPQAVQQRAGR